MQHVNEEVVLHKVVIQLRKMKFCKGLQQACIRPIGDS